MSIENPFSNPPQETPKPEEEKLKQPIEKLDADKQELSEEQEEQYKQWMEDHPEIVIAPEDLRECGPEIAEFKEMIASFESTHPLAELLLIIDLTPEEALEHPTREPARKALIPIVAKLNLLKAETNITSEKHEELKAEYLRLSRAVGMINKNKVDHNR